MNKLVVALLAGAALFGFGMQSLAADSDQRVATPGEKSGAAKPSVCPPKDQGYACPSSGYVNCMPPVERSARDLCDPEYLTWAKSHCPGLKIVY
jgi:hypothetical protein